MLLVSNRIHIVYIYKYHQLDEKYIPSTISRTDHTHNDYYALLEHSHSYNDLEDKPSIATLSDIVNTKYNQILMLDNENGFDYIVSMRGGKLISYCAASSIAVTAQPAKVAYTVGETFDTTDMIVTATCQDGSTREVTNYTYSTDVLTTDNTSVEISYTENRQTFTTTVAITVTEATTK